MMSSFWKSQPLERVIRHRIEHHQITAEKVKPGKRLEIQEANDRFVVRNETGALANFWIYLSMSLLILVICISIALSNIKGEFLWEYYLLALPTTIIALFHLAIFYLVPVKEIILDRLNGKITYPRLFANKKHRTIWFDYLQVYETMTTTGDFAATGKKIRIKDGKYSYTWDLESSFPEEYWSFMVWYMDKNRPLPPGSAFDPYRQRDFERRKAEGFPKPLYPSVFETPEATTAQQRERKKIGGW